MKTSELWAAWILAAMMVGLVAWVGHGEPGGGGIRLAGAPHESPMVRRAGPLSGEPWQVYLCVIDGPLQGAC